MALSTLPRPQNLNSTPAMKKQMKRKTWEPKSEENTQWIDIFFFMRDFGHKCIFSKTYKNITFFQRNAVSQKNLSK